MSISWKYDVRNDMGMGDDATLVFMSVKGGSEMAALLITSAVEEAKYWAERMADEELRKFLYSKQQTYSLPGDQAVLYTMIALVWHDIEGNDDGNTIVRQTVRLVSQPEYLAVLGVASNLAP